MKKRTRFLSMAMSMLMLFSVLPVNTQAKAAKSYVKSISIAKTAAITIPENKATAAKSYAVTVKVNGKATRAFTAKSNKTSVAAVKVKGSKVNITAKKAGTAKITVTTKGKSLKNKRLSKTMTLTVKKAKKKTTSAFLEVGATTFYLNPGFDSKKTAASNIKLLPLISNKKKGASYTVKVRDEKVVSAMTVEGSDTLIYAVGEGKTIVDVYEEDATGKISIGTLEIEVEKADIAGIVTESVKTIDLTELKGIWIKLDFLPEGTYDLGEKIKSSVLTNESIGLGFDEKDYSISYESNNTDVVSVNDNGILTGYKNGDADVAYFVKFSDGSVYDTFSNVKVTGRAIKTETGYTMENVREHIVGLDTPVELSDGTKVPLTNFDNAATTPAFEDVKKAVVEELEMYGSIGRGFSQKSNHSTDVYNNTRDKVLEFLGADPEKYTCFYVNNTTDGLNKLASAIIEDEKDLVLTTRIEHHANDLSWRERCKVIYAEVDEKGRVKYDDLEKLLKENKVKYVSVTAASNVTGYVTDVHRVAKLAHQYGAKIVVDGAQIVAHRKFSMIGDTPEENIDFFVFSAHKMYSPYGGGAVVGLTEVLNKHMPEFYGGGTIKVVGDDWVRYKTAPAAYEAGSPNYPGVVGLGKAIDILSEIGLDKVQEHERVLNRRLIDGLKKLDNIIIYGDTENIDDKVGVVSFNFSDINTYYISQKLSELGGVATRRGAFCAHPYVWRLMGISDEEAKGFENCSDQKTAGMVRVSFGIYNNEEDVDKMLAIMPDVMKAAKEAAAGTDATPQY